MLMPSEEQRVATALKGAGVPIKRISTNKNLAMSLSMKAAALLASRYLPFISRVLILL